LSVLVALKLVPFSIPLIGPIPSIVPATKKRIVKDYDQLPEELVARIKLEYPFGFEESLVSYRDARGDKVSALPFDTEDVYFLIRMTKYEAQRIVEEDDDYNEDGNLRKDFAAEQEAEVAGEDEQAEFASLESDED